MIKAVPVDKKCSYIKASALMVFSFIQLELVDSLIDVFFFQMKEWYMRTKLPVLCMAFRNGKFWIATGYFVR